MSQSPNPAAAQQVSPLLALATTLLRAGRTADAIVPLRDAALLDSSNPLIQHDLGLACLEVGQLEDAVAALLDSKSSKLSGQELDRLQKLIDKARKGGKK